MAEPGGVLGVGIATVDIVNRVASYPPEDAEVRAMGSRRVRGGNCANTLAILADLGRPTAFVGTLAEDAGAAFIRADLAAHGVDLSGARAIPGAATPTSYINVSAATGSRTIVHHRDLAELTHAQFAAVGLAGCAWVHFEGRNVPETAAMIARVRRERPDLPVSVELEKPRPGIDRLLRFDAQAVGGGSLRVLILARAFALAAGARDPDAFLADMAARSDADLLFAPWGATGAYGLARGGAPWFAPAAPPARLVDSIGAGDVFNAAVIDGLLVGLAPPDLLARANRLAGHACGCEGLAGVVASAQAAGLL